MTHAIASRLECVGRQVPHQSINGAASIQISIDMDGEFNLNRKKGGKYRPEPDITGKDIRCQSLDYFFALYLYLLFYPIYLSNE